MTRNGATNILEIDSSKVCLVGTMQRSLSFPTSLHLPTDEIHLCSQDMKEGDIIRTLLQYIHLLKNNHLKRRRLRRMFRSSKYTEKKISRLGSFYKIVGSVDTFLEMFDTEYASELDASIDMENGEAFTLWNHGCDIIDLALQITKGMKELLDLFQMYGRSFTISDKEECIKRAKMAYKSLDVNFTASVKLTYTKVKLMHDIVNTSFEKCNFSMNIVATDCVAMKIKLEGNG